MLLNVLSSCQLPVALVDNNYSYKTNSENYLETYNLRFKIWILGRKYILVEKLACVGDIGGKVSLFKLTEKVLGF